MLDHTHHQENTMHPDLDTAISPTTTSPAATPSTTAESSSLREYIVLADDEGTHDSLLIVVLGRYKATRPHEARIAHVKQGKYTEAEKDAGIPLRAISVGDWDRALKPVTRKVTEEYV